MSVSYSANRFASYHPKEYAYLQMTQKYITGESSFQACSAQHILLSET